MILLKLYIQELTNFLRTATIKNTYFAEHALRTVREDLRDKIIPEQNPYYIHLSGDYVLGSLSSLRKITGTTADDAAQLNALAAKYGIRTQTTVVGRTIPHAHLYTAFDDMVFVHSYDDQTLIPFTKKALKLHPKTASAYKIPGQDYINLVTRYPEQADIIKNISYPIPSLAQAIAAPNYTLLYYEAELLEANERASLLSAMEDTLEYIRVRWDIKEYTYEDLYAVSAQSVVWSALLLTLLRQRVSNIRTGGAHPYHIWEYLKSHGIGDFRQALSQEQQLFLYRNIDYLLKHKGTSRNLVLLVYKLLSDWSIGLYSKNIQQQIVGIDRDGKERNATGDCRLIPNITSVRVGAANLTKLRAIQQHAGDYIDKTKIIEDEVAALDIGVNEIQEFRQGTIETLDDVVEKEVYSGIEYEELTPREINVSKQAQLFANTPHTILPTKLLELRQDNLATIEQQIYIRYVSETLFYLSSVMDFDDNITVTTNELPLPVVLSYKQALLLLYYAIIRERGFTPRSLLKYRTSGGILDFGTASGDPEDLGSVKLWPAKNSTTNVLEIDIPQYAHVSWPFKSEFDPLPTTFTWNNKTYNTKRYLRIVPLTMVISGTNLPNQVTEQPYTLVRKTKVSEWSWSNGFYVLRFVANAGWLLSSATNPTESYRCNNSEPYASWHVWESVWYTRTNQQTKIRIEVTESVNGIDEQIQPTTVYGRTGRRSAVLNTMTAVHNQGMGLVQLYRETYSTASAQTSALVTKILEERMHSGMLPLNLTTDTTFAAFLNSAPAVRDLITALENTARGEASAEMLLATTYGKLGTILLTALYPIESQYVMDSSATTNTRFALLKQLLTNLCSYNIAFISSTTSVSAAVVPTPVRLTSDIMRSTTVIRSKDRLPEIMARPIWYGNNRTNYGTRTQYNWLNAADVQVSVIWKNVLERAKILYGNVVNAVTELHELEVDVTRYQSVQRYKMHALGTNNIIFGTSEPRYDVVYNGVLLPFFKEPAADYLVRLSSVNAARTTWLDVTAAQACYLWVVKYAHRIDIERYLVGRLITEDEIAIIEALTQRTWPEPTAHPNLTWAILLPQIAIDPTTWNTWLDSDVPFSREWLLAYAATYNKSSITANIDIIDSEWLADNAHLFTEAWLSLNAQRTVTVESIYTTGGYNLYTAQKHTDAIIANTVYDPANDPMLLCLANNNITYESVTSHITRYTHNREVVKQMHEFVVGDYDANEALTTTYQTDDGPLIVQMPDGVPDMSDPYWSLTYVKDGVQIHPAHYPTYNILLLGIDPDTKLPIVEIPGS